VLERVLNLHLRLLLNFGLLGRCDHLKKLVLILLIDDGLGALRGGGARSGNFFFFCEEVGVFAIFFAGDGVEGSFSPLRRSSKAAQSFLAKCWLGVTLGRGLYEDKRER